MSKKFSASRKRAFLHYLAQTGNQTLSAERAKVSRSWVQLHRSTDPEFDAACRRAIEATKGRFQASPHPNPSPSRGGTNQPPSGWGHLDGAELVVRGTGGSGGGKRVQIARARVKQWTARVEARFLAALAGTCNVKAACAQVGMWPPSAYNHRKRWPAFTEAWDEAVETGYVRIEAALVENACNLFSTPEHVPDIAIEGMTAWEALQLLHMHKHAVRGIGGRPGLEQRSPGNDEIARALEKRLKSFNASLDRQPSEGEVRELRRQLRRRRSR